MTSLGMFDFDSGHCMLKKKLKISFETLIEIVTRQDQSILTTPFSLYDTIMESLVLWH